ncbi:MAG: hypothetical protein AAGH99_12290 [Planctomycetota bacterium]
MATTSSFSASPPGTPSHRSKRPALVIVCLLGAFLAPALPMIFTGYVPEGRIAKDHYAYHRQVINQFVDQWPSLDWSDYLSATTPGYHTMLTPLGVWLGPDSVWLQAAAAVFTAALLALWGGWLGRRLAWPYALCASLPLLTSLYFFPSGVWLLPDNAGWLGGLAVLLLCWSAKYRGVGFYASVGALMLYLVWVRQSHIWIAAVVWVAAYVDAASSRSDLIESRSSRSRLVAVSGALMATLPAAALLVYFVSLWGGLTPPSFGRQGEVVVTGPNPATPALFLAVWGFVSFFFAGYWLPSAWRVLRNSAKAKMVLAVIVFVGIVLAVVPPTQACVECGRFGGFWGLSRIISVAGRSPILIVMAIGGAACMGLMLISLPARQAWIGGTAACAFVAAQTANAFAFQRYLEPLVLILVPLIATSVNLQELKLQASGQSRFAWVGPAVLSTTLAAFTIRRLI